MNEYKYLMFIFAGLVVINATLAAVLWAQARTPMYRSMFLVWAFAIVAGLAQGVFPTPPWTIFAFGFSSFLVSLALADLARRCLELEVAWRAYVYLFALLVLVGGVLARAQAPFWVTALPVAFATVTPLLDLLRRAVFRQSPLTMTARAALASIAFYSLHMLDYPFLRNDPRFALWGGSIGMLVLFALSITAPAIILESATVQAVKALRAREEFMNIVAHELRTPLTSLMLQTERAVKGLSAQSEERRRMELIDRQANRLGRLVDQLLDFARIGKHQFQLEYSDGDFTAVVNDLAQRMQLDFRRSSSMLTVALPGPITGRWDLIRVEQLLANLLSNAIKFGEGKPIELKLEDQGKDILVQVTDHGIGISPDDSKRLFQPFERAGASHNYGGLGLGLWICSQIADAHHGSISVTSDVGKGAAFKVVLPKSPPTARA